MCTLDRGPADCNKKIYKKIYAQFFGKKGKVCIQAKWPIRLEHIPVSAAETGMCPHLDGMQCPRPGGRFSKAPETFRARKAIAKSRTLRLQSCYIIMF